MFFQLGEDRHINLNHVRSIEYDGQFTRLFFSGAAHDCLKIPGDLRQDILKATAGSKLAPAK